ncbi:MAG: hypothetical protein R3E60_01095 [Alphaproteobacteria bacterium]
MADFNTDAAPSPNSVGIGHKVNSALCLDPERYVPQTGVRVNGGAILGIQISHVRTILLTLL